MWCVITSTLCLFSQSLTMCLNNILSRFSSREYAGVLWNRIWRESFPNTEHFLFCVKDVHETLLCAIVAHAIESWMKVLCAPEFAGEITGARDLQCTRLWANSSTTTTVSRGVLLVPRKQITRLYFMSHVCAACKVHVSFTATQLSRLLQRPPQPHCASLNGMNILNYYHNSYWNQIMPRIDEILIWESNIRTHNMHVTLRL